MLLQQQDYDRINEFLLRLDFANQEAAKASSARWVQEVRKISGISNGSNWGERIVGARKAEAVPVSIDEPTVRSLDVDLLNRKREGQSDTSSIPAVPDKRAGPTLLSAGLLRKKPKKETAA